MGRKGVLVRGKERERDGEKGKVGEREGRERVGQGLRGW